MSSAKWKPIDGGWGFLGSTSGSDYGKQRRTKESRNKAELSGHLSSSLTAMSGQLEATSTLTANQEARAESKYERAGKAFERAEEQATFAGEKADLQESNADLSSSIGTAQTAAQGKAAASQAGMAANKVMAGSGFASMGEVQAQHQDSMNDAYGSAAMSQAQQGMGYRNSMMQALEGRKQADWSLRGAKDQYDQAGDDMQASIDEAQLTQAQAVAGMAKDISSMVSAFKDATDGETYSSDELAALQEDMGI